jgi:hypothetical protein
VLTQARHSLSSRGPNSSSSFVTRSSVNSDTEFTRAIQRGRAARLGLAWNPGHERGITSPSLQGGGIIENAELRRARAADEHFPLVSQETTTMGSSNTPLPRDTPSSLLASQHFESQQLLRRSGSLRYNSISVPPSVDVSAYAERGALARRLEQRRLLQGGRGFHSLSLPGINTEVSNDITSADAETPRPSAAEACPQSKLTLFVDRRLAHQRHLVVTTELLR